MSASDWVSVASAAFLAVAAVVALITYRLATMEHREARADARREPWRRLLMDAVEELKGLALASEELTPGIGAKRLDIIQGHQQRLAIALGFVSWAEIARTTALTVCSPSDVTRDAIAEAAGELYWDLRAIERGVFDKEEERLPTYRDEKSGDLPPLPPPQS